MEEHKREQEQSMRELEPHKKETGHYRMVWEHRKLALGLHMKEQVLRRKVKEHCMKA
jgi:hypothetical protein